MADFLASFDFGAGDESATNDPTCASLDELQVRLQEIILKKTTETRAEHISTPLDIASAAQFVISTDRRSGGQEGIDGSTAPEPEGEVQTRIVTASEALRHEPSDEPVVQRAVAEQIVFATGAVDQSTWVPHDMELEPEGWTLTYICDASLQHWKSRTKPLPKSIPHCSRKDIDPTIVSRPAFDCRGSITISFSRKSRFIAVNYRHTVLHRSIGQLAELFKPPPRVLPADGADPKYPGNTKAQDEKGNRRKSKNKNKKQKGDASQPEAQLALADQATQALQQTGFVQALQNGQVQVGDGNSEAARMAALQSVTENSSSDATRAAAPLTINVSPAEAQRRRDVAVQLLGNAGVDPNSLSPDQFNIFANQSPELQKDSLNMLATYGAERLHIIHPSHRDSSTSVPPSTAPTQGADLGSNLTTTKELVPQRETTGAETAPKISDSKSKRGGKFRLACKRCKGNRIKCPKERPTCSECQNGSFTCEYPVEKPRKKKKTKSDAIVVDEDGDEGMEDTEDFETADVDETMHDEPEQADQQQDTEQHHVEQQPQEPDDYQYPQVPDTAVSHHAPLHIQEPPTQLPYFQSAPGLALPQPDPLEDVSHRHAVDPARLHLPTPPMYYSPLQTKSASSTSQSSSVSQDNRQGTGENLFPQSLRPQFLHQQSTGNQWQAQSQSQNSSSQHPPHYSPNSGMKLQRPAQRSPVQQKGFGPRPKSQTYQHVSMATPPQSTTRAFQPPQASSLQQNRQEKVGYQPYSYQNQTATASPGTANAHPSSLYGHNPDTTVSLVDLAAGHGTVTTNAAASSFREGSSASAARQLTRQRQRQPEQQQTLQSQNWHFSNQGQNYSQENQRGIYSWRMQ